jgi:hypothetical protein
LGVLVFRFTMSASVVFEIMEGRLAIEAFVLPEEAFSCP